MALLVDEFRLSRRRACRVVGLSRAAWYRPPVEARIRDAPVIDALNGRVAQHSRWGFWKCHDRLRLDGYRWNHQRLWRVYRALGLHLPRRSKRRVPTRLRQPLAAPPAVNQVWAVDFMHDALYGGRRFRTLNVLDEGNREGLTIEVGTSLPAARVIRVLDQLTTIYGRPDALRLDNGPEITSALFTEWCAARGIAVKYIQPGHPAQNAFIERFNRTYREEILDAYLFESVAEVQDLSDERLRTYNERRPHEALGSVPPIHFQPRAVLRHESTTSVST